VAEYVYGIVSEAAQPPSEPGIAGAELRLIKGGSCAALVSDVAEPELRFGRAEAIAHARVLEAALAGGTVLPMRFGVIMNDPEEVRNRLLADHEPDLRAQLDSFAGKVEVSIRALYEEQPLMRQIVSEEPEIARLRASLQGKPEAATYYERIRLGELIAQAVERRREADTQEIVGALADLAVTVSIGEPAHERVVFNASFLVESDRMSAFDQRLDQIAADRAERMRFKYTGPLPPHSFVELTGSA
jgi:hypothetical protein